MPFTCVCVCHCLLHVHSAKCSNSYGLDCLTQNRPMIMWFLLISSLKTSFQRYKNVAKYEGCYY